MMAMVVTQIDIASGWGPTDNGALNIILIYMLIRITMLLNVKPELVLLLITRLARFGLGFVRQLEIILFW